MFHFFRTRSESPRQTSNFSPLHEELEGRALLTAVTGEVLDSESSLVMPSLPSGASEQRVDSALDGAAVDEVFKEEKSIDSDLKSLSALDAPQFVRDGLERLQGTLVSAHKAFNNGVIAFLRSARGVPEILYKDNELSSEVSLLTLLRNELSNTKSSTESLNRGVQPTILDVTDLEVTTEPAADARFGRIIVQATVLLQSFQGKVLQPLSFGLTLFRGPAEETPSFSDRERALIGSSTFVGPLAPYQNRSESHGPVSVPSFNVPSPNQLVGPLPSVESRFESNIYGSARRVVVEGPEKPEENSTPEEAEKQPKSEESPRDGESSEQSSDEQAARNNAEVTPDADFSLLGESEEVQDGSDSRGEESKRSEDGAVPEQTEQHSVPENQHLPEERREGKHVTPNAHGQGEGGGDVSYSSFDGSQKVSATDALFAESDTVEEIVRDPYHRESELEETLAELTFPRRSLKEQEVFIAPALVLAPARSAFQDSSSKRTGRRMKV